MAISTGSTQELRKRKRKGYTIWVCLDCFYADHDVATEDDEPHCEPWSKYKDQEDVEITYGLLASEHAEDCNEPDYCDCNSITFSKARCDGCGCHLAGQRFAYTEWELVS